MPVAANDMRLAASPGADAKRKAARWSVAQDFFGKHLYQPEQDWELVRRAMQCIDMEQPVVVGPPPIGAKRLVMPAMSALGPGFFSEQPARGTAKVEWWRIAPEAPYLKWFAPFVMIDDGKPPAGRLGEARYFVPAARSSKGAGLAIPERQ
jgi:hypothetical protein